MEKIGLGSRVKDDKTAVATCEECESAPALFNEAIKLITEMSRHSSDSPATTDKIEIFFQRVSLIYPYFRWSQFGGIFSSNSNADVFKRRGRWFWEDC